MLLSHVLEVDIVDRTLDKEAGQLHTTRAITVNAPGPWWLQRLMGETVCHCLEKSTVDAGEEYNTFKQPFAILLEHDMKCIY